MSCFCFSPLGDTPAKKSIMIIIHCEKREVSEASNHSQCTTGASAGDIESHLKLLVKDKCENDKIVIHAGGNDSQLCQWEVTKINVESVCTHAKKILDSVIFSGALPNLSIALDGC